MISIELRIGPTNVNLGPTKKYVDVVNVGT